MTAAAIKATWATYKPVPTRNVLQLTLEVPLEQQADVFKNLGYPVPGSETWVGVALLNPPTDKPASSQGAPAERPKQRWAEMSRAQQAGILCADKQFQRWIECRTEEEAIKDVRSLCNVVSRSQLDLGGLPAERWDDLVSRYRNATGQQAEQRG